MYKIDLDLKNDLVELDLQGFWTESEFDQFIVDERAALNISCSAKSASMFCFAISQI